MNDNQGIVSAPGLFPDATTHLKNKKNDYRKIRRRWFSRPLETYEYPPDHWSPDDCMLFRLPTELVFQVIEDLYQADLFHLALTCRRMADCTLSTLYRRDITRFGCMALRWACTFGIIPTLERTIQCGAPVDHVFSADSAIGCNWIIGGRGYRYERTSALVTAIVADEPSAVRALCNRGGVNDLINKPHDTYLDNGARISLYPIHYAMGNPNWPVQRRGVRPGNPEIVRTLLDAGADPNQESKIFRGTPYATPLFLAMQSKVPVETVRLLLERGADPLIRVNWPFPPHVQSWIDTFQPPGSWSKLPLQMLLLPDRPFSDWAWGTDWEKVKLLLAYGGADDGNQVINSHSMKFWPTYPLLYHSLDYPHSIGLSRLILDQGADLAGWTTRCGISPIQAVIWWAEARSRVLVAGDMAVVPNVLDRMCELVTMMAEASSTEATNTPRSPQDGGGPSALKRRSAIVDSPMWIARIGQAGVLRLAASHPTPLSYVCSPFRFFGATRLIPILLRFGADVNARCSAGVTALHHAVMFHNIGGTSAVRLLVNHDGGGSLSRSGHIKINARDRRGWTPLHYACHFGFRRRQTDQADAVRILLDHGADIHARSHSGVTPLLLAVWCCNVPVVKLLLERGALKEDLGPVLTSSQVDDADPGKATTCTVPYIPLIDHESIIFEHTSLGWEPWGSEGEREVGKSILEIYDLLFPLFDSSFRIMSPSHDDDNRKFQSQQLPEQEEENRRDAANHINSIVSDATNTNTTKERSKKERWVPSRLLAEVYKDCLHEIEQVTQERFNDIAFNTAHQTHRLKYLRFPSFDLTVYTVEVFSYQPTRLCATSAPWIWTRRSGMD